MFNFYQYNRLEKEQDKKLSNTATSLENPKRIAKYLNERDRLAERYNKRIVDFLEQAASDPQNFQLPDKFTQEGSQTVKNTQSKFLFGRERMKFTTNSTDQERIQAQEEVNSILDTKPLNITEIKAWNLRPRSKDKEIGPDVRHKPKMQMERIYDHVTSQISPTFKQSNLAHKDVHDNIKQFAKHGNQTFSSRGFSTAKASDRGAQRNFQQFSTFLSQTTSGEGGLSSVASGCEPLVSPYLATNSHFLQPQKVLHELHKKSHFKGAAGLLIGKEASLEMKQSERMAEVFTQITKSMKMRRDTAALSKEQHEEIKAGLRNQTMRTRRNITLLNSTFQKTMTDLSMGQQTMSPTNSVFKQGALYAQPISQSMVVPLGTRNFKANQTMADKPTITPLNLKDGWVMQAIDESPQCDDKNDDPKSLTNSVLKMCNVIRTKHPKVPIVGRSTGRGGQGPFTGSMGQSFSGSGIGQNSPNFTNATFYLSNDHRLINRQENTSPNSQFKGTRNLQTRQ